jgi:RNA polymerase sigma factor (sigma-70 family)
MPASSTDIDTRIRDINQRATELYLELKNEKIGPEEYQDSIAALVFRPLVSFIENALPVRTRNDADDIFQETMLRFLERQSELDLAKVWICHWLFKVAAHYTIDEWRKTRREEPTDPVALANLVSEGAQGGLKSPAMEREQILKIAVRDAFRTLAEEWRPAGYLCLALRFTQNAAAEILNLPETTVNYYVGLSKARLKANAQLREFSSRARGKE